MKHYSTAIQAVKHDFLVNTATLPVMAENLEEAIGKTYQAAKRKYPGQVINVCIHCFEDGQTYSSTN